MDIVNICTIIQIKTLKKVLSTIKSGLRLRPLFVILLENHSRMTLNKLLLHSICIKNGNFKNRA